MRKVNKRKTKAILFSTVMMTSIMGGTTSLVRAESNQVPLDIFVAPSYEEIGQYNPDFVPLTNAELEELSQEEGQRIAKEQTERLDGEVWELSKSTKLKSNSAVATKYIDLIPANTSKSKAISFSFSIGTDVGGYKLGASFSRSVTQSQSGPSTGQKVANSGLAATHAYFIGVQYGEVYQYEYKVYNKYSGQLLRTEKQIAFVSTLTTSFALRANVGNPKITMENSNQNNYKTFADHNTAVAAFGTNKTGAIFY